MGKSYTIDFVFADGKIVAGIDDGSTAMSKKTSMMVIVILFAISLLCRWLFVPVQAIELFQSGTVDWVEQLEPDLQEQLESY